MARDPFQPVDDEARQLARELMETARHGALGVLHEGTPFVTRVALAYDDGTLLSLVSDLAPHTAGLRANPMASILIGEPGKGDPLAHPRLTLTVTAEFTDKSEKADAYLRRQPKAKLYISFADFHIVRLHPVAGHLNGGFGKAFRLSEDDLRDPA